MALPFTRARTRDRRRDEIIKAGAAVLSSFPITPGGGNKAKLVDPNQLARQASLKLAPIMGQTPEDIQAALLEQGLDWVQQFAPGEPLRPFYSYSPPPGGGLRTYNYTPGQNVAVEPRSVDSRIPFATLAQIIDGYDIAVYVAFTAFWLPPDCTRFPG